MRGVVDCARVSKVVLERIIAFASRVEFRGRRCDVHVASAGWRSKAAVWVDNGCDECDVFASC